MTRERVADFYVVLEARGINKAAAIHARTKRPSTSGSQIAVRVRLTLPPDAFTEWVPLVEATVEQQMFVPPTVEVAEPEPLAADEPSEADA